MLSFALVTEGITDQVLLTSILIGHYGEEPDISEAQPLRDATDESRQGSFAGWENVLAYCSSDLFEQQFYVNDYVIVQIDTDVCGHKNFEIDLRSEGKDRATQEIIDAVKNFIIQKIDPSVYEKHKENIIFAISIHSLECWLLPAYGKTEIEKKKIRKCELHLAKILERFDIEFEKTYSIFQLISEPLTDSKNIKVASTNNESFRFFLNSLPNPNS